MKNSQLQSSFLLVGARQVGNNEEGLVFLDEAPSRERTCRIGMPPVLGRLTEPRRGGRNSPSRHSYF
jgi:hypothetical protein